MDATNPQVVGWTAILGGIVAAIGFVSLILLFVIGEPFGTINDALSVPVAFLLMPLVVALFQQNAAEHPWLSRAALLAGCIGYFAAAAGSTLLIFGWINFQTSLLFGIGGFGLIGLWLALNSITGLVEQSLPRALALAGVLLAIGPDMALLAMFRLENLNTLLQGLAGQTAMSAISPLAYLIIILGAASYALIPFWTIWIGRLYTTGQIGTAQVLVAS